MAVDPGNMVEAGIMREEVRSAGLQWVETEVSPGK